MLEPAWSGPQLAEQAEETKARVGKVGRSMGEKERIGIGTGCLSYEFRFGGITGNTAQRAFQIFPGTVLLNISDITSPTLLSSRL